MLAPHLLSKNIRIQITLSYQWLTIALRSIKTDSLLLDVNKDSSSSNSPVSSKSKGGQMNYLDKREELRKKKLMEKELSKTAETLTSRRTNPDKKILDTLLTNISNIKSKNTVNAFNKINKYKKNVGDQVGQIKYDKDNEFSVSELLLKEQKEKEDNVVLKKKYDKYKKNVGDQVGQIKYDKDNEFSVSKLLLKEQKEKEDNVVLKTKYDDNKDLSVAGKLLKEQHILHENINNFRRKREDLNAVMHQDDTQRRQQRTKYTSQHAKHHGTQVIKESDSLRGNVNFDLSKIFSDKFVEKSDTPIFSVWHACAAVELQVPVYPRNTFEEMIKWTEEGKLWKFPINNEQDMKTEQNVHFSRHVFLERHLAEWCPAKGPIRHFMELVCVGLSKNPYMTIEEKEDHLTWYKNYFNDKRDFLKELKLIE